MIMYEVLNVITGEWIDIFDSRDAANELAYNWNSACESQRYYVRVKLT